MCISHGLICFECASFTFACLLVSPTWQSEMRSESACAIRKRLCLSSRVWQPIETSIQESQGQYLMTPQKCASYRK